MTVTQKWNIYINNRKVDSALYADSMSREQIANHFKRSRKSGLFSHLANQKGPVVVRKARK